MSRKLTAIMVMALGVLLIASVASAGFVYVATAKNLRGALYIGAGPTPNHASEMAIVKCSQDSVIPVTCKVVCMRKEITPPPLPPKVRKYKPIRKYKKSARFNKNRYSWGRPMP